MSRRRLVSLASLVSVTVLTLALLVLSGPLQPAPALAGDEALAAGDEAPTRIVAYYFHGSFRCATCRKLEAYSEEAIVQGFPDEIASGRLSWRVVNTDEAESKHFVKDFELVTKSLVLVEYRGDEVVRFSNLKLIWQLVGDKPGFLTYVREATAEMLGRS
jgi:hypothetical protein